MRVSVDHKRHECAISCHHLAVLLDGWEVPLVVEADNEAGIVEHFVPDDNGHSQVDPETKDDVLRATLRGKVVIIDKRTGQPIEA